jgi:hypothetical protein
MWGPSEMWFAEAIPDGTCAVRPEDIPDDGDAKFTPLTVFERQTVKDSKLCYEPHGERKVAETDRRTQILMDRRYTSDGRRNIQFFFRDFLLSDGNAM